VTHDVYDERYHITEHRNGRLLDRDDVSEDYESDYEHCKCTWWGKHPIGELREGRTGTGEAQIDQVALDE
jgi:hypothetical protein